LVGRTVVLLVEGHRSARRARMSLAPRTPSRPPRAFRNKAGLVSGPGTARTLVIDPDGELISQLGVQGDLPVPAALAGADNDP
jgi:hypothetical protein